MRYRHPIVNVEEVAAAVRRFLDTMSERFAGHPLWKVSVSRSFAAAAHTLKFPAFPERIHHRTVLRGRGHGEVRHLQALPCAVPARVQR